jgi:uncharacterized Zn finger protein
METGVKMPTLKEAIREWLGVVSVSDYEESRRAFTRINEYRREDFRNSLKRFAEIEQRLSSVEARLTLAEKQLHEAIDRLQPTPPRAMRFRE